MSTPPANTVIRNATTDDAESICAIYRPFVLNSAISFEAEVPSNEEMAARIDKSVRNWGWLVAQIDGQIAGYAYGSSHRPRAAYNWSVETSAYLRPDFHRRGIASALYTDLITVLAARGFGSAFAGITVPNEASIGFHRALGFEMIGVFPGVGRKFGKWHDVAWMSRVIQHDIDDHKVIT